MFSIPDFLISKHSKKLITMLTCYDAQTALILEKSGVDSVLVGDSVSMVIHGMSSTTGATMDMMEMHVRAVRAGSKNLCVVADMPFLSTRKGLAIGVENAQKLMVAGANAVKIEGLAGHEELIKALVGGGVPVMGHLGLQPQSVNVLGGYKKRGKNQHEATTILNDAKVLQDLGCFGIVLECIPQDLAMLLRDSLEIPVIGIGAGQECDGQILVLNDMLGLNSGYLPSFVKTYGNVASIIQKACEDYIHEVQTRVFPSKSVSQKKDDQE